MGSTFLIVSWAFNIVLCVGIYVYWQVNKRRIIKNLSEKQRQKNKNIEDKISGKEAELKTKEIKYKTACQERENEYNKLCENKNAEIKKREEELNDKIKSFEEERASLIERFEQEKKDFENEKKQVEEDIKNLVADIDKKTGEKIKEIAMSNTLEFKCACSDTLIPCSIDFTKDNTYRCSKCGTVYRVDFRAEPVSIGRSASEEEYLKLVERRLDEAKVRV